MMTRTLQFSCFVVAFFALGIVTEAKKPSDSNGETKAPKAAPKTWTGQDWLPQQPLDLSRGIPDRDEYHDALEEQATYLCRTQLEDGSWEVYGLNTSLRALEDALPDFYSTALAALALEHVRQTLPEERLTHWDNVASEGKSLAHVIDRAEDFLLQRLAAGHPSEQFHPLRDEGLQHALEFFTLRRVVFPKRRETLAGAAHACASALAQYAQSTAPLPPTPREQSDPGFYVSPKEGLRILGVRKDSNAERAGLKAKDQVVSLQDTRVFQARDLIYRLSKIHPGEEIELKIRRMTKEGECALTLRFVPDVRHSLATLPTFADEGDNVILSEFGQCEIIEGVKILRQGMEVHFVNGHAPKNAAHANKLLSKLAFGQHCILLSNNQRIVIRRGLRHPGYSGIVPEKPFGAEGYGAEIVVKQGPDSPATLGGFRDGDVVTFVNGEPITSGFHLRVLLSRYPSGTELGITYLRGYDDPVVTLITLGEQRPPGYSGFDAGPAALAQEKAVDNGSDPPRARFVVRHVESESPAIRAGLEAGDLILKSSKVDGQALRSLAQLLLAPAGAQLRLVVLRDGERRTIEFANGPAYRTDKPAVLWRRFYEDSGETMLSATIAATIHSSAELSWESPILNGVAQVIEDRTTHDEGGGIFAISGHDQVEHMAQDNLQNTVAHIGACVIVQQGCGDIDTREARKRLRSCLRHRGELDVVRSYPDWRSEEYYGLSAFDWWPSHRWNLRAAKALGDLPSMRSVGAAIWARSIEETPVDTLLAHEAFGREGGAAFGLLALVELESLISED